MLNKRETHKKDKASIHGDEEFLDMNVFDMFTGKHNEIVSNNDDDSTSINKKCFILNRLMSLIDVI
jgi:hypothetical protein